MFSFKRVLTCDWQWGIFALKMDFVLIPRDMLSDATPSDVMLYVVSWLPVIRGRFHL